MVGSSGASAGEVWNASASCSGKVVVGADAVANVGSSVGFGAVAYPNSLSPITAHCKRMTPRPRRLLPAPFGSLRCASR